MGRTRSYKRPIEPPNYVPPFSREKKNRPIDIFLKSMRCWNQKAFKEKLKKMSQEERKKAKKALNEAKSATKILRKEHRKQAWRDDKKNMIKVINTATKKGVIPKIPNIETIRGKFDVFIQKGIFSLKAGDLVAMAAVGYPGVLLERRHQDEIHELYLKYCREARNPPNCLHGFYFFSGVVVIPVLDQDSKNRLAKLINEMRPLRDGTKLKVLDNTALSKFWLFRIFLPGELKSTDEVLRKLKVQNPALNVDEWTLKSSTICDPDKFFLTFKIPVTTLKALGLMKFQVCYNLETTRANFIIDKNQTEISEHDLKWTS